MLSNYFDHSFGKAYGLLINEWYLLARTVLVLDANNKAAYVEYLDNINSEPNCDAAIEAIKVKEVIDLFFVAIEYDGDHHGEGLVNESEGCVVESFACALLPIACSSYLLVQRFPFGSNKSCGIRQGCMAPSKRAWERTPVNFCSSL